MKRYQVYLNPESVEVLDQVERLTSISRSQMIRAALDVLSRNLAIISEPPIGKNTGGKNPEINSLISMAGCIDARILAKAKKISRQHDLPVNSPSLNNLSQRDDRYYLED